MRLLTPLLLALTVAALGCEKAQNFTTNVEVVQVQLLGSDPQSPIGADVELRYADCPGDSRRILRGDAAFSACARKLKKGEKVPVDLLMTYNSARSRYRVEVTKLADCSVKQDPKDEANYEMVETCTDVKASGAIVGVRCDRTRNEELVAKCPWFKRK